MRRYIPALLLVLTAFAPFPLAGCDLIAKLKGGGADAAAEAAAVEAVVDAAPAVEDAGVADAAVAKLPVPATKVVVKTDAGIADAAVALDAAPPPSPIPALLDAGGAALADAGGRIHQKIIVPKGLLKKN